MSDTLRAAAQQALEALEHHVEQTRPIHKTSDAIDALRAALAAAEPFQPDWDRVEALQESLREHMEEVRQLREQNTALDAKLAELEAAAAAVAEPVAISVVAVAEVVDRDDGPDLNWLLEGGIYELPAGVVLLMSDKPLTDADGHGHVYAAPPQREPAYRDSTPHLNVGNSAFESWFQAQPFATQIGIKQISRDSYAAGMGDPLVAAAVAEPVAWDWLRGVMDGIPTREERIGGQREKYVAKEAVMGWLHEGQSRSKRAAPPQREREPLTGQEPVAAGFKLVPQTPTRDMLQAARVNMQYDWSVGQVWSAMLAATPAAPPQREPYDQTALDLCNACGWKAFGPDGCLNCAPQREREPLTDQKIEDLAHREAWTYRHSSDPHHSHTYKFNRACLLEFARKLLAASAPKEQA